MLAAACAVGVSSCFGSPIGGMLIILFIIHPEARANVRAHGDYSFLLIDKQALNP